MSLYHPEGSSVWRLVGIVGILALFVGALLIYMFIAPKDLDRNLCPTGEPSRNKTILVIDTSDPLTPKHKAELDRLLNEFRDPPMVSEESPFNFYVQPGEELIVYELNEDLNEISPMVRVCNPGGNPDEWDWRDDLTRGKMLAVRDWKQFESALKGLFPAEDSLEDPQSLILENLSVLLPNHVKSIRQQAGATEEDTHLIIFSDLLQNSDLVSHYAPYESDRFPATSKFLTSPALRELSTDLTGVRVSLLRLIRSKYAHYQTVEHRDWWANFIKLSNGKIHYIDSI